MGDTQGHEEEDAQDSAQGHEGGTPAAAHHQDAQQGEEEGTPQQAHERPPAPSEIDT